MIKYLPKTFKFSLTTTTVTLLLCALMIRASVWQWERYKYKVALLDSYKINSSTEALELPLDKFATSRTPFNNQGQAAIEKEVLRPFINRKVKLEGQFDFSKQLIVTNKSERSGPGHIIITPLKIKDSDNYVLISRGFIPFSDREPETWGKYNGQSQVQLEGILKESLKPSLIGPKNPERTGEKSFPYLWYFEEISKMSEQFDFPIITAFYLQQLGNTEFPKEFISIEVPPSTHFGYTIEWGIIAFVTLVFGIAMQLFPAFFNRRKKTNLAVILFVTLLNSPILVLAETNPENVEKNATIKQNIDHQLDLNLSFRDQGNNLKTLGEFLLPNRPTIIAPVYYRCPRLCTLTLNGLIDSVKKMDLKLGDDYRILAISINPEEGPELAYKKSRAYYEELKDFKNLDSSFQFLTSDGLSIKTIMNELGFEYYKDKDEFAHAASIMLITPTGKISRYFIGVEFPPKELKYSLIEASQNKIGNLADQAFLYCFRFDSTKGKYSLAVWRLTQLVCLISLIIFFTFMAKLWFRDKTK